MMDGTNMEALLDAVREGKAWLDRFTGRRYPEAFQEYTRRFGPLYEEAVRDAGEEGLSDLAETLLDGLEEGWKRRRIWDRAAVRATEKQMVVDYLSPMLLQSKETEGFSARLRDAWCARWPKDAYRTATYDEIRGGFRTTILGIPLPDRRD